jgi:hypothetical protein
MTDTVVAGHPCSPSLYITIPLGFEGTGAYDITTLNLLLSVSHQDGATSVCHHGASRKAYREQTQLHILFLWLE